MGRITIVWLTVALLGQALWTACAEETVASCTAQLLQALNNPDVSFIWVNQSMKLPAPGVLLTFQHLQLLRTVAAWGPFLASIDHSARSRVRMHNAVRSYPFCPASLEWLNQQVASAQNDKLVYYSDGVAWFEYYDVYLPCLRTINAACVKKKGYGACFNQQMRWIIWQEQMLESKWEIAAGRLIGAGSFGRVYIGVACFTALHVQP
eukprot:gene2472-2775_t